MDELELTDTFDRQRPQLRAVAYRILASRARRRVRDAPLPDPNLTRQQAVVDAYFAAAREGDLAGRQARHPRYYRLRDKQAAAASYS